MFVLNYQFKLTKQFKGIVLWDMDYFTKMFVDDANTQDVSEYFYGNVMAGVTWDYKDFNLLLTGGIKNIFDRKYIGFININANPELPPSERRYYEVGEPRSYYFGLNMGYAF